MTTLRWILLALLLIAAMVVASLTAEPGEWRQTVKWADARLVQLVREASSCPVLVGHELEGDARALLEKAAQAPMSIEPAASERLRQLASRQEQPGEGEVVAFLELLTPAMAQLERAVCTAGPVFRTAGIGDASVDYIRFGDLFPVVDGFLLRAQHAEVVSDRVDAWLHALACGIDMASMEAPVVAMLGVMVVQRAIAAVDDAWLQVLPAGERMRLAAALAAADGGFADSDAHSCLIAVHMVRLLERGDVLDPFDLGFGSRMQAWQHGFSLWHAGVERASGIVEQVRRFEQQTPAGESWPERRRRLEALVAWDKRNNGDLTFGYLSHAVDFEEIRRTTIAELRLMRLAVAHHLGRALPSLPDPLGEGPLRSEAHGQQLRCFSAAHGVERHVGG